MGDIQELEVDDLVPLVGAQAIWIKELSVGICKEEVAEKTVPRTASAIKTFRDIRTFEKVLRQISLCCIDLLGKIREHMREKQVFPVGLHVGCRQVIWSRNPQEVKENSFAKTLKMVPWEDFEQDSSCFE